MFVCGWAEKIPHVFTNICDGQCLQSLLMVLPMVGDYTDRPQGGMRTFMSSGSLVKSPMADSPRCHWCQGRLGWIDPGPSRVQASSISTIGAGLSNSLQQAVLCLLLQACCLQVEMYHHLGSGPTAFLYSHWQSGCTGMLPDQTPNGGTSPPGSQGLQTRCFPYWAQYMQTSACIVPVPSCRTYRLPYETQV